MEMPNNPPVAPAVRITVLLRLASEGYEDTFERRQEWLTVPLADLAELREAAGWERGEQHPQAIGLREGRTYMAGGPAGTVSLSEHAHRGVLGLMGLAALPADVLVEETPEGPRYSVPDAWFIARPAPS